jgi:hypothetical protein
MKPYDAVLADWLDRAWFLSGERGENTGKLWIVSPVDPIAS